MQMVQELALPAFAGGTRPSAGDYAFPAVWAGGGGGIVQHAQVKKRHKNAGGLWGSGVKRRWVVG